MAERRTLLVVEDQPEELDLLLLALEKADLGVEVCHVSDGEAALSYFQGLEPYADRKKFPLPALVLLDIRLPFRSGFEVLEWVKQKSDLAELPVIVFSSSRDPSDIARAYQLGANSYLCKPPEFRTFVEMLKSLGSFWINFSVPPSLRSPQ